MVEARRRNERHGDGFIGPGGFFCKSGGSDIIFAAHDDSAPPPSHRCPCILFPSPYPPISMGISTLPLIEPQVISIGYDYDHFQSLRLNFSLTGKLKSESLLNVLRGRNR